MIREKLLMSDVLFVKEDEDDEGCVYDLDDLQYVEDYELLEDYLVDDELEKNNLDYYDYIHNIIIFKRLKDNKVFKLDYTKGKYEDLDYNKLIAEEVFPELVTEIVTKYK